MLPQQRFVSITNDIVIPYFESGYYHPDMAKNYSAKDQAILKDSGETMFGEDRKAGKQLAVYPEWKQFWDMIDADRAKNPKLWKHYYMGGAINAPLKELCSKIMYQWFNYLAAKYLKGDAIDKIVADDRLLVHFSYASWNGEGWFERFAKALNKATGTREEIFKTAIDARLNAPAKAIRNAGVKMLEVFKKLKMK